MKNLSKKIFIFLLAFLAIFLWEIPFVSAEDPKCDSTGGNTLDDIASDTEGTGIAIEITEPLGSFEQKISSGGIDVSAVYWKFDCTATTTDDDGNTKTSTETRYLLYANKCPESATCTLVQIIRGTSGTGILKTYIAVIYRWAAGIVGIIAVLVIVISGIQISMDQGSGESVGAAKTRIMQSLSGLVILFLSALILYTINPTFFTK